jgi:FKBP-type peptidyl-prolyl cis-trans isomerase (trigger factor)
MKVEVKKLDQVKRIVKVEVSGEEFTSERSKVYQELGKDLKVPGFRPGTAPIDVLEKHHGKLLKEEFLEKVLPYYYGQALQQEKMSPAGYPKISDVELTADKLVFNAELEVRPEITIDDKDYKGIEIKNIETEVKDGEVDKVIDNLKEGVKKLLENDLPEEGIAKWSGYPDFAFLKEAVKKEIAVEKLRNRKDRVNSQVVEKLLKSVNTELPKGEVERHHKELVDREVYNLHNRGISEEDIEKYKKDIEEKLKTVAEDQVKLFYILEAIAAKENLKAEHNLMEVVLGYVLSQADYK